MISKVTSSYEYDPPKGLTVSKVMDVLLRHMNESQGQGKSRLPILAIQAIYDCLIKDVRRYEGKELVKISRHTANDKKGSIGDVQVNYVNNGPFEGVEVKSGIAITPEMVRAIPTKLQGHKVERYYILSTLNVCIDVNKQSEVADALDEIRLRTGCEIIANGLVPTLRYYLRLIVDKDTFLEKYTNLLLEDEDIREPQREVWGKIIEDLQSGLSTAN